MTFLYFRSKPSPLELWLLRAQSALAHLTPSLFFLSSVPSGLWLYIAFLWTFSILPAFGAGRVLKTKPITPDVHAQQLYGESPLPSCSFTLFYKYYQSSWAFLFSGTCCCIIYFLLPGFWKLFLLFPCHWETWVLEQKDFLITKTM